MKLFFALRNRLNERSTWLFWIGSMGTVAAFPSPFNYVGAACLFVAGLVPDGGVTGGQPNG